MHKINISNKIKKKYVVKISKRKTFKLLDWATDVSKFRTVSEVFIFIAR